MNSKNIKILISLTIIYIILKLLPFGNYILYPINLIVTFLHEFGHAFFAILTGGKVESIKVNFDGSGVTYTRGGIESLITAGGYIGSAIFGNILLYTSIKSDKYSKEILYGLGGLMIFCSFIFFSGIFSSLILIIIGGILIFITKKFNFQNALLGFIGFASLIFIISDFRVGPSSDLERFSEIFIFIPKNIWMYLWLFIVLGISFYNLRLIFKNKNN